MVRGVFAETVHDLDRATRSVIYDDICRALEPHGLIARGGFTPNADDGLGSDAACVVMVGNAGPAMWGGFAAVPQTGKDPMNLWARRVLGAIARTFGCAVVFPFEGPPWLPFQRWAMRAEAVSVSPVGILIHPEYGLWHAYRGAFVFREPIADLPPRDDTASPCETCDERPCLSTCPVHAFDAGSYDVPACRRHLQSSEGSDCMDLGCRARRACPIGRSYRYHEGQARFHMEAFLSSAPRP